MNSRRLDKSTWSTNGDDVRLPSLGVHEHRNNAMDKKYARNLGKSKHAQGIELLMPSRAVPDGPVANTTKRHSRIGVHGTLYRFWLGDRRRRIRTPGQGERRGD